MFQPEFITYLDRLEYSKFPLRSFFSLPFYYTQRSRSGSFKRYFKNSSYQPPQKNKTPPLYEKRGLDGMRVQ